MKTLSIIIPVLNEQDCIVRRLGALQYLRDGSCELIIVDGGSSDSTAALAAPLVDRVVLSEAGRAAQMNIGAAEATGDVLLFLHIDTTLPVNTKDLLFKAVDNEELKWGWFKLKFNNPAFVFRVISACMNMRAAVTKVCTGDQTLYLTRKLFEQIDGFPEILLMEDVAISKILRRMVNPKIITAFVQTSARRWENNGILRSVLLMWWLRLLFFLGVEPSDLAMRYYSKSSLANKQKGSRKGGQSSYQFPDYKIILFAKAPVLGQVKTRLEPELGMEKSLDLYRAMLRRVIKLLDSTNIAPWDLWVSSVESSEFFQNLVKQKQLFIQNGEDLGQKMANAMTQSLAPAGVKSALILGCDCPAYDYSYLIKAIKALEDGNEIVLGPAEDSGYVLIGMNAPYSGLFEGVKWGSDQVLSQTLANIYKLGLTFMVLEPLWDVDRPEDLTRLAELDPQLPW